MDIEEIKDKRLYIMLVKNNPCCDCGNKYHYSQMQLDHKPEFEKHFMFGSGRNTDKTIEDYKEEIKKCDLVCANCHAKRTFLRSLLPESKELLPESKELHELTNEDIINYLNGIKLNSNKRNNGRYYEKRKLKRKNGDKI